MVVNRRNSRANSEPYYSLHLNYVGLIEININVAVDLKRAEQEAALGLRRPSSMTDGALRLTKSEPHRQGRASDLARCKRQGPCGGRRIRTGPGGIGGAVAGCPGAVGGGSVARRCAEEAMAPARGGEGQRRWLLRGGGREPARGGDGQRRRPLRGGGREPARGGDR